jgi:hypothetical protein
LDEAAQLQKPLPDEGLVEIARAEANEDQGS